MFRGHTVIQLLPSGSSHPAPDDAPLCWFIISEATEHTRFLHKHSFVRSSHVKGQTWTGRRLHSWLLVFSFIMLKADKISTSSSHSLSHQSLEEKKIHAPFCWPWSCWLQEAEKLRSIRKVFTVLLFLFYSFSFFCSNLERNCFHYLIGISWSIFSIIENFFSNNVNSWQAIQVWMK